MENLKVLYEDNHLIAVFKPAGVLTQGDKTGDISLYDMVKDYIRIKKGKRPLLTGNAKPRSVPPSREGGTTTGVFLGLLHRLDRPVSGIILFAKTSKGASRLSEQFRTHEIEKIYHALVMGKPARKEGILTGFLEKDEKIRKAKVKKEGSGKQAELTYKVVSSNEKYSLLEIRIDTGRFHQIRAQLSSIGCPILGDIKYGAPFPLPDRSIALSATSLSFITATTKELKEISLPVPSSWGEYIKIQKLSLVN